MRFPTCFLWICLLLDHDCVWVVGEVQFQKMAKNLTCGKNTCGPERTAQDQVCGCDSLCEIYGDCCPDYTGAGSSLPSRPSDASLLYPSPMSCVDTPDLGYLLVSKCPSDWTPDDVSKVCESDSESYGLSPAYMIPVSSARSRLSYKNMFCAYCNGQTLHDMTLWPLSYVCHIEIENMTFGNMFIDGRCEIQFDEPTRRGCAIGSKDCRGVDVSDDKTLESARDLCNRYTDYMYTSKGVYKNAYCHRCHQSVDTADLQCPAADRQGSTSRILTHYQLPALTYSALKEEEPECYPNVVSAMKRCIPINCPPGYMRRETECSYGDTVTSEIFHCSIGWNTDEPPFRYIGPKRFSDVNRCEHAADSAYQIIYVKTEDNMMKNLRSLFKQTNYKAMYMSSVFPTAPEMFGKCDSTTTTGKVADNNAQLLAFVEEVKPNLTWPWLMTLNVKKGEGEMYLGNLTVCELVPMCRLLWMSVGAMGTDFRDVSFVTDGQEYVCVEAVVSIERKGREDRNEKLRVFLKRADRIDAPPTTTTTTAATTDGSSVSGSTGTAGLGVSLVVVLMVWVCP